MFSYPRPLRPDAEPPVRTDRVQVTLPDNQALAILRGGDVLDGHQVAWGSNYTFLVNLDAGPGEYIRAVYKPRDGEQALYDFPRGTLYQREYAAYLLSTALGWPLVPATVVREGPYGIGSMHLYIQHDPETTYFDLVKDHPDELLRFAVFDVLANNADRKGGHCLLGEDGNIWSIDHGLTFHHVFKMRTVMLEFWDSPIPQPVLVEIEELVGEIDAKSGPITGLVEMLTDQEMNALRERAVDLLDSATIPKLDPRYHVPWPLV